MRVTGRRRTGPAGGSLALLGLLLLAGSCVSEAERTSTPPEGSRAVAFPSSDGVELEGRLAGDGRVGVVLSHMRPADQRSWWDFAGDLVDEGYMVLTFDFRGYCPDGAGGCSSGERDLGGIWQDVLGAISFLRAQGVQDVVLMGASMGGTASLLAASRAETPVEAVVTLSAPVSFEGMDVTADVLGQVSAATLFIAGSGDGSAPDDAQRLYAMAPPPKRVEILTTDDHGTDILFGNQSGRARTLILTYLEMQAPAR